MPNCMSGGFTNLHPPPAAYQQLSCSISLPMSDNAWLLNVSLHVGCVIISYSTFNICVMLIELNSFSILHGNSHFTKWFFLFTLSFLCKCLDYIDSPRSIIPSRCLFVIGFVCCKYFLSWYVAHLLNSFGLLLQEQDSRF